MERVSFLPVPTSLTQASTLPPLLACLCIMSCELISAKMLAGVRIFSQGDICILIGGLNMEKLLPKAGKPHWEEPGNFGREQGYVKRRHDHILLCVFHRTGPFISLFLLSPNF